MNRHSWFDDLRISARALRAKPGFALTIAFILALGIGANVTLFTVINGMLLRPLPFERVSELVEIEQQHRDLSAANLNRASAFSGAAAWTARNFAVAGEEGAKYVFGFRVTSNLFSVLGVHAALGRVFQDAETDQPVAMLGYEYWRQTSGDPNIVGQNLTIDNVKRTIVGVLGPEFSLQVRDGGVFLPYPTPDGRWIGRLKSGATMAQANAEVTAMQAAKGVKQDRDHRIRVLPITEGFRSTNATVYIFLQGAVGLLLLITCLNVANLLLVRSAARRREFAIRAAIGAGRARLLWQLLIESVLMAIAGGVGGLLLANWGLSSLNRYLPAGDRRLLRGVDGLAIDYRVVAFAIGISLVTVLLFGLAPAIRAVRFDVMSTLRNSARGTTPARQRFGQMLVVGEVALSLMLLIAAGLMLKSLFGLERQNLGFSADHVLRVSAEFSKPDRPQLLNEAVARVARLPGVETVGVLAPQYFPFGGPGVRGSIFEIRDRAREEPRAEAYTANPDYFHAVRLPLLKGRLFTATDTADSSPVALISSIVARRYWTGSDPLGQSIRLTPNGPWITIVGVVGDVRNPIGLDFQPTLYRPMAQSALSGGILLIRTANDPMTVASAVIKEMHALDTAAPAARVASLERAVADYITPQRFSTSLLGIFAGLGLLLAAMGIYGVIRYWVSVRISEIGVRVALGADRADILRLVVAKSALTTALGTVLGIIGALALQRWIASQLYGASPVDAEVFAGVSLLMILVAVAATLGPARWAMKVDPMEALRHD